ncbi:MAG: cytochrome c3 family protein [Planctomycetes bacterium]|nr:cytochrome c3 family protein [Planctomycetota bacterium]
MQKVIYLIIPTAVLFFNGLVIYGTAGHTDEKSSCIQCHSQQNKTLSESIHIKSQIKCVDCHGGDSTKSDKVQAKSPQTGYRGKIKRTEIPKMCSSCHSDVEKMNPYGFPTDQYTQYLTSRHGKALVSGKEDVAVCTDCHKHHDVKSVKDPGSPVFPANVPSLCGSCHSDFQKMNKHDLSSEAESKYRQSIHADLLLKKGDLSAPTCSTCHGNHGAKPPGFKQIEEVCGKCHTKQKEFFEISPHFKPTSQGEFKGCVTCHGNHRIPQANLQIFENTCNRCHEEDDKASKTRNSIINLAMNNNNYFNVISEQLENAKRKGFPVDEEQVLLEEAKTYLMQFAPLQHTLDILRLYELSEQAKSTLNKISKSVREKEESDNARKIIIIPIAAFLVVMSLGSFIKYKQISRNRIMHK